MAAGRRRRERAREQSGSDSVDLAFLLTLLLIVFLFTLIHLMSVVTLASKCRAALFWLGGWLEGGALLQHFFVIIALIAVLFVVRFLAFCQWRRPVRSLVEASLIAALAIAALTLKAFYLPNGVPSAAQVQEVLRVTRLQQRIPDPLEEELRLSRPFLDPAPQRPWEIDEPDYASLFPSRSSPTHGDMLALRRCVADHDAAVAVYRAREQESGNDLKTCDGC
ncbi:MAG: hypothetical protein VX640_13110 [Pseudomonadota bacterium]|nr:hypothetical protein [Pseudomonadota bacterium]